MPALLGALLAVIVVAVLLQPLLTRRLKSADAQRRAPDELREKRRAIYRELANLQNDFESGHIAKSQYERLSDQLRRDAAMALRDEDESRADAIASEIEIEAQVRNVREQHRQSEAQD